MGARGPLKMPSHLRAVGSAVPSDSVAEDVPREAPEKPGGVAGDAALSALWDQIVPELDRIGLVAASDGPGIELMLRHYLAARRASDELLAGPQSVDDRKNRRPMKNPAEPIFRAQSMAFLEYAKQFGMTFVARARTPAAKGREDGEANPFGGASVG